MLPIKFRDEDFLHSDYSLFTLIDKETQTESLCVSEQASDTRITNFDNEQDVNYTKVREYCQILSESGIFNTKIRIEKIEQNKQGVLSAKSSHGTFLIGKIFQRQNRDRPYLDRVPTWKLDESFEKEYPNSGYIYIPCFDAEKSTEDLPNNGCVFIPNEQTQVTLESGEENGASKNKCLLITNQQTCFDARDSHENEFIDEGLINTLNEETYCHAKKDFDNECLNINNDNNNTLVTNQQICLDTENTKVNELPDINFISNGIERTDLNLEINNERESTDVSLTSDLIHETCLKEKESPHVTFISNSIDTSISKDKMSDKKTNSQEPCSPSEMRSKRLNNLAQGLKDCLSSTISIIMKPICSGTCSNPKEFMKESVSTHQQITKEDKGKESDETSKSLKLACGSEIDPACSPKRTPSSCNIDKDSTQTIELKQAIPLINDLRPNGKFGKDDYIFESNHQLRSVDLDKIADKYSEDARNAMATHNIDGLIKLTANSSNTTDDTSANMECSTEVENTLQISNESIEEVQTQPNDTIRTVPFMAKVMEAVESTVLSLREHVDLDRISYFKENFLERKNKEEESISSEEQIISTVHPNPAIHNRTYSPPPRSMFTSFKSTIFGFFGDKEKISEPSDCSSCSTSGTSSGLSAESTDAEGDPLM